MKLATLHTLLSHRSEPWYDEAACRDADTDVFFPSYREPAAVSVAKGYCYRCPVSAECLADALAAERKLGPTYRFGVFGGTTPIERAELAGSISKSVKKRLAIQNHEESV